LAGIQLEERRNREKRSEEGGRRDRETELEKGIRGKLERNRVSSSNRVTH
jgi:hypothetical protein